MKMKVYSIGREDGCDIVINDNSDATSRRHATLTVMPSGKMTITDQSRNGTYVNGIRISQNVAVPVTRKDNISFAHVYRLDWNMIPKPVSVMQYVIYGLIALAVIGGGVIAYLLLSGSEPESGSSGGTSSSVKTEKVDSCETCKKPISECEYKGKHADGQKTDTCKTCRLLVTDCRYKGKHPTDREKKPPVTSVKICSTCGKNIKECPHKGKHPLKKENTRADR